MERANACACHGSANGPGSGGEAAAAGPPLELEVIALDEALQELATLDADQARIVELRFFGGLTTDEAAAVMGVSPTTAKRKWLVAKAWLYRELKGGAEPR